MNLFGVGNLEIAFVLLVAVLVLGPARMADAARSAGQMYRKARNTLREIIDVATVDLDAKPSPSTPPREPIEAPLDAVSRGGDPEPEPAPEKAD